MKVYDKKEKIKGWLPGLPREHAEVLDVDVRKFNNMEVNLGFTQEQALSEADRCMRCYYIAMVAY
jgi:formate dehydrogenase beta subunit